jgi:hypothetical protein
VIFATENSNKFFKKNQVLEGKISLRMWPTAQATLALLKCHMFYIHLPKSDFRHFGVEKVSFSWDTYKSKKMLLANKQFLIIIFVTKNLLNDCISSSNSVELIK